MESITSMRRASGFASRLGGALVSECGMAAEEGPPAPWEAVQGDDGVYYFNAETGVSQWEFPTSGDPEVLEEEKPKHSEGEPALDGEETDLPGPQTELLCREVLPLPPRESKEGEDVFHRVRAVASDT